MKNFLGNLFSKVQGDVYETSLDGSIVQVHQAEPTNPALLRAVRLSQRLQALAGEGIITPPAPQESTRKPTHTDQRIIQGYGDDRATDGGL